MRLPRRKFLHLAAGAAALPAIPLVASCVSADLTLEIKVSFAAVNLTSQSFGFGET
jgi:hypothetical protein